MKFKKGKWYKTTNGFDVEFIVPIEKDGMYNVFRHNEDNDFLPFYTDEEGKTAYGEAIEPYNPDLEKGYLYIVGSRVYVTGTQYNGLRGRIVEKPDGWPIRSQAVQIDEWDDPVRLFRHNLIPLQFS